MRVAPSPDTRPWYRQFWPWLLIAIPSLAVLGGMLTLFLALYEPDGLVSDDYYKRGLAVNQDLSRDRAAQQLGLSAQVLLRRSTVVVSLHGHYPMALEALRLRFVHPTRAHYDVTVALRPEPDGHYLGEMGMLVPGRWHLQLEPQDGSWRLLGRITVPGQESVRLTPGT